MATLKDRVKDIELALVETVVDISRTPRPQQGDPGKNGISIKGDDGDSAYKIWQELGNKGSKRNFIASLKGKPGVTTTIIKEVQVRLPAPDDGEDGLNGLSAYEIWLKNNNGTEGDFLNSLKGAPGITRTHHTFSNVGNSTLHAGEIGRLSLATSVLDSDDFAILRSGQLLRVTAETLAAYIVAENTTTKEITFADSPYSVTILDDFIDVDSSGGNVVINFLSLSTVPIKPIYVRQTDGEPNTTTGTANGSDPINDAGSTLVISSDGNAEMFVPFPTSWRTF